MNLRIGRTYIWIGPALLIDNIIQLQKPGTKVWLVNFKKSKISLLSIVAPGMSELQVLDAYPPHLLSGLFSPRQVDSLSRWNIGTGLGGILLITLARKTQ